MDTDDERPADATRAIERAHRVLRMHLPQRDWWWLGLRLRCHHCGQRFPCPPRRVALRHLDRGVAVRP